MTDGTSKVCRKCGLIYPFNWFYKQIRENGTYGRRAQCKKCLLDTKHKYLANPENRKKQQKTYKEYHNKLEVKKRKRNNRIIWEIKNKERTAINLKRWKKENPNKIKILRLRQARKRSNDPLWRMQNNMSRAIRKSLKDNKNGSWTNLVDYSIEELKMHLEQGWEDWMSWDNYGRPKNGEQKWVIDHIKPQVLFIIIDQYCQEFKDCWALNNLQPLSWIENSKKHARYMEGA
ncbi:MAG: hypothetical protein KJI71_01215 [Patescibacteria group bacterium]|nr:hypothetical protein [Patescibacteria group bacterium]